jgi:MFS transporter, PPP family, 3-phenylpropionic acid transporter
MTARAFSIRFSLSYAFMMLGTGVQLPFLPLWLAAKGIDYSGIAFIVGAMMAVRVLSAPLFAWIADHLGRRRVVIRLCALFSFACYLSLGFMDGSWPIATVALLAAFFFAPIFPLSEGFSVDASVALGLDYGRMRLWASVSFLAGSLGAGLLLTQFDALATAWILAAAMGMTVVSALVLPPEPENLGKRADPVETTLSTGRFLFASSFPVFLLAAGLAQASHGLMNSFSSVHWHALGFDTFTIGMFWSVAVSLEVLLLAFSNAVVGRFGSGMIFLLGAGGGVMRWSLTAFATSMPLIMALQTLHAVSFAMTHLGTMHMIRLMVPANMRNRAQGLHSALSGGLLMSLSMWSSGPLFEQHGGLAYLFMAVISLTAFMLAVTLLRVNPRVRAAAAA